MCCASQYTAREHARILTNLHTDTASYTQRYGALGMLRCGVGCCGVLQYVVGVSHVHTNTVFNGKDIDLPFYSVTIKSCITLAEAVIYSYHTLQHTATYCNTLQHTATH